MRKLFLLILNLLIISCLSAVAQTIEPILSLTDFLKLVEQNHPSAKRAALLNRTAEAELLSAKGGFDPKAFGDYEQKFFKNQKYFGYGEYGVKVPTALYGLELKAAYNTTEGNFINPSEKLPTAGQAVLGLSMPLLQGLMIDDRRANRAKAQQSQGLNQSERNAVLNDLALEATTAYWKWSFSYQQLLVFQKALSVAEQRFVGIKSAFDLGDRMAMDTLESWTQVQDRQLQFNEVQQDFREATLKLNNFLWGNASVNTPILDNIKPQTLSNEIPLSITPVSDEQKQFLVQNIAKTHPLLRGYDFKLAQLEIEKRLKREKLKPKLNLNYNFLGNGFAINNVFSDNYKWGIQFSTSTLFRAERADVQLADIKIENTRLFQDQKLRELENKLQLAFRTLENVQAQIQIQNQSLANFEKLLTLENTRFQLGESSFFLINSRESKFLEAQIKMAKLQAEWKIAQATVTWATGYLGFNGQ
ncbi:MAG: TolC family protein [Saprospiraceae bacterium]|nr:TolC family protein [Saprospiraceae bacterium]